MTSAPEHFKKKLGAGFLHCLVFGIARIGSSGNTQQDGSAAVARDAQSLELAGSGLAQRGLPLASYAIESVVKISLFILSEIRVDF